MAQGPRIGISACGIRQWKAHTWALATVSLTRLHPLRHHVGLHISTHAPHPGVNTIAEEPARQGLSYRSLPLARHIAVPRLDVVASDRSSN